MPRTRWTPETSAQLYTFLQTNTRAPQNTQTAAEVHSLVAVDTDEHEIARINMQCAAVKQAAAKFSHPPAKLVKRMARGVVLAAEPGPSGWRNADIAAIGRSVGRPAVLRDWIGSWTQAMVPYSMANGRRLRLLHLTVDRRNQSQDSACRSRAHGSSAILRWQRCSRSWVKAV